VETLLPLLAFVFGSLVITAGALAFMPSRATAIDRRLEELLVGGGGADPADVPVKPRWEGLTALIKRIGEKAPKSPKEMGSLRLRLVQAGYRREEALTVFFGIRIVFALGLFFLFSTSTITKPNLFVALGGLALGYLLPGMLLARMAKRRAHRIRLSLADMLDLLVVSVEAGLGLDQALTRVGHELAFAYPELSDELRLINLELRAGKPRSEALRNLADRTGVDDLSSLVTMLIQTDKFGTSVAQSLRVYSETLRTKRRQRAEEAAAKTGVKMVFPLVVCIFPAIWIVTIGPAAIRFVTVLVPLIEKQK
jgi:tight adherence protein C